MSRLLESLFDRQTLHQMILKQQHYPIMLILKGQSNKQLSSDQKLLETDNSDRNKLRGVPHITGSRTAFVSNELSLGGLSIDGYIVSTFVKTMLFCELWSIWLQALSITKKRSFSQHISQMGHYDIVSDMVSSVIKDLAKF